MTNMQLTQWRQFEEDQNNPNQMAKYFSSPSKSQPSVYSQDEIYYLLGENNSMKKLLNEVLNHNFMILKLDFFLIMLQIYIFNLVSLIEGHASP